jgi:hypothetical protein
MTKRIGHNQGPGLENDEERTPHGRQGYVLVSREMRDHPIVGFGRYSTPADPAKRFCYGKSDAWLDLIMECRYEAGRVNNGGRIMEIQPGQLIGAVSWLAARWNWTPKAVRHFLDVLEEEGMITVSTSADEVNQNSETNFSETSPHTNTGKHGGKQRGKQAAIISISKYEIFQRWYLQQGQANGQEQGQERGEQGASEGQHLNIRNTGNTGIDSHTADALSAPRETNVFQLSTLSIPATMREQPMVLPRLMDAQPLAKKPRKPRSAKTMLPSEWTLPKEWLQWALDRFDVPLGSVVLEAERFKTHWLSNGEEKANWEMTWRNWCGSPYRKWRPKHGAPVDIIDKNYAPLLEAEVVPVDVWAEQRAEAARRRAEEDGA